MSTQSTRPRRLLTLGLGSTLSLLSGCLSGPGFFQQNPASSINTRPVEALPATVESDQNGVVVALIRADATTDQVVAASQQSAISKASIIVPVGSLGVETKLTIEEGQSLVTSSEAASLGVDGATNVADSAPAVVIQSTADISPATPMTLSLPIPSSASLALTQGSALERLVVIFKAKKPESEGGGFVFGIIPLSELVVADGVVRAKITRFGSYQSVITKQLVVEKKEIKSEQPIVTARQEQQQAPQAAGSFSIMSPLGLQGSRTPLAKWTVAPVAAEYKFRVGRTNCDQEILFEGKTSSTEATLDLKDDGKYVLCVYAVVGGAPFAATNNGIAFAIDATPPVITNASAERGGNPLEVKLSAVVTDGTALDIRWEVKSGNGVTIADSRAPSTIATLSAPGDYTFAIFARDEAGHETFAHSAYSSAAKSVTWTPDTMTASGSVSRTASLAKIAPLVQTINAASQFSNGSALGINIVSNMIEADVSSTNARDLPDNGVSVIDGITWFDMTGNELLVHVGSLPLTDTDPIPSTHGGNGLTGDYMTSTPRSVDALGPLGRALSFQATNNEFVDFGDHAAKSINSSFTIAAWFNTGSGGTQMIAGRYDGLIGWYLKLYNGKVVLTLSATAGDFFSRESTNTYYDGQWHHVVAIYEGNPASPVMRLFVDGQELTGGLASSSSEGTAALSNPITTSAALTVGGYDGGYYFDGALDEVAIWNRPLSAGEPQAIHARQSLPVLGVHRSAVIGGASPTAAWSQMFAKPKAPSAKPLPNFGDSESGYSFGIVNMANNELLLHFDESAPTSVAVDKSRTASPYSISIGGTNTIVGVPGVFGGAWANFQSDAYLNVGHHANLAFDETDSFTVATWIRFDDASNMHSGIVSKIDGTNIGYEFWTGTGGMLNALFKGAGGQLAVGSGASLQAKRWYHVAMIFDRNPTVATNCRIRLFLDTSVVGSQDNVLCSNLSGAAVSNDLVIGRAQGFSLNGALDDLAIWSRALGTDEIGDLYARGANQVHVRVRACGDPSCTGNPPFVGPSGTGESYFSEQMNTSLTPFVQALPAGISGPYFQFLTHLVGFNPSFPLKPTLVELKAGPPHFGPNVEPLESPSQLFSLALDVEIATASSAKFLVSNDNGANWRYFDGTTWAVAPNASQTSLANDLTAVRTNVSKLPAGTFKLKALLYPGADSNIEAQMTSVTFKYMD